MKKEINTIDAYIASFPEATQKLLHELRAFIKQIAPEATETISYGIPTFVSHGNLVHFAGYKQHIGFYPGASGIAHFQQQLSAYHLSKGTVQFPLDKQLPFALIKKIVVFRLKENEEKARLKKAVKTCPNGHRFVKTSDCPTCPKCEEVHKPTEGFLSQLAAPARRSLEREKITTLKKLSNYSESEILALHGMGPASMPILKQQLKKAGLMFKKK